LARPNARSSHKIPTPQGGGIAVLGATIAATLLLGRLPGFPAFEIPITVFGAALFLAVVGAIDDIRPIPALPRLAFQTLAVGAVLITLPSQTQIIPACPLWLERTIVLVGGLWFVNLVNFMDGLDLMTVVETVPIAAAIVIIGLTGDLAPTTMIVAAALGGAIIGFAPFNRPVARVFLGDVGSLPIGLLVGWCLLDLAYRGQLTAALLLPLYYLSDATITLLRRLLAGEKVWEAHRSHFYQRATDNGFTVTVVISNVLALNMVLAGLAIASTTTTSLPLKISILVVGAAAVMGVLFRFARPR
jgi:UDP-N-acetylmuramyl pentapeptide phosphotransferase/UDP-N-acetylglucosamine-1-phosphate transferase